VCFEHHELPSGKEALLSFFQSGARSRRAIVSKVKARNEGDVGARIAWRQGAATEDSKGPDETVERESGAVEEGVVKGEDISREKGVLALKEGEVGLHSGVELGAFE
jgi:hypothetical protein